MKKLLPLILLAAVLLLTITPVNAVNPIAWDFTVGKNSVNGGSTSIATNHNVQAGETLVMVANGIPIVAISGGSHDSGITTASDTLSYSSHTSDTIFASVQIQVSGACTSSTDGVVSDSGGSTYSLLARVNNPQSGDSRTEDLFATGAGASVASTSFTVTFTGGVSCDVTWSVVEYTNIASIGSTTTNQNSGAASTSYSISDTINPTNWFIAGIGGTTETSASVTSGNSRQMACTTSCSPTILNIEGVVDNTGSASVTNTITVSSSGYFAAVGVEVVGTPIPSATGLGTGPALQGCSSCWTKQAQVVNTAGALDFEIWTALVPTTISAAAISFTWNEKAVGSMLVSGYLNVRLISGVGTTQGNAVSGSITAMPSLSNSWIAGGTGFIGVQSLTPGSGLTQRLQGSKCLVNPPIQCQSIDTEDSNGATLGSTFTYSTSWGITRQFCMAELELQANIAFTRSDSGSATIGSSLDFKTTPLDAFTKAALVVFFFLLVIIGFVIWKCGLLGNKKRGTRYGRR